MSDPLPPPKKKNPVARTPAPTLPPAQRSRTALGLTRAAALGRFEMQVCSSCQSVQYPPREVCGHCLHDGLHWQTVPNGGQLIASTTLHHSNDLYFKERLPWRVGMVRMDAGPSVVAHIHADCPELGAVRLALLADRSGQAVLHALPLKDTPHMFDAPTLRAGSCNPAQRRILVSDGKTAVGQAIARTLLSAGAQRVLLGDPEPWNRDPAFEQLRQHPQVQVLALDCTSADSVQQLAANSGGQIEIVIHNPSHIRDGGLLYAKGILPLHEALQTHAIGLARLAQALGPALAARAGDASHGACAWVNLLSIHALAPLPQRAAWSAAQAAAHALSISLRAELAPAGVRVLNLYCSPIDEPWEQTTPAPKLAPSAVAKALVQALITGQEDSYLGDIAEDIRARQQDNAKALERELAQQR